MPLFASGLLLGGASAGNALHLLIIQLVSLPYLVIGLARWPIRGGRALTGVAVLAAIVAVVVVQLIPLPPDVWTRLPGRAALTEAMALAGVEPHWAPLSLTPSETVRSLLFLLHPYAILLTTLRFDKGQQQAAVGFVLILTLFSFLLGGAQIVGPEDSPLYLYDVVNRGTTVGLFANRNHQASLLLAAVPLATALALSYRTRFGVTFAAWVTALAVGLLIAGLAGTHSRAGILLVGPALAGSLLLMWTATSRGQRYGAMLPILAAAAVAAALVFQLALGAIAQRFDASNPADLRVTAVPAELAAARTYFPVGAGLGAFRPVYNDVEVLETMEPTYFNHAHNEYLELLIETGVFGPLVLIAFLAWYGQAAVRAWRAGRQRSFELARAGSIVIALLLAHSAVDYPLRTPALAAVFALACGLLWSASLQLRSRGAA